MSNDLIAVEDKCQISDKFLWYGKPDAELLIAAGVKNFEGLNDV